MAHRGKGKLSRDNHNNRQEWTRQMRLASLAVAIPTILGGSPVVGALLGRWLAGLIGHAGAGTVVGLVIGFIAGARETVRLIRYLQKQTRS